MFAVAKFYEKERGVANIFDPGLDVRDEVTQTADLGCVSRLTTITFGLTSTRTPLARARFLLPSGSRPFVDSFPPLYVILFKTF